MLLQMSGDVKPGDTSVSFKVRLPSSGPTTADVEGFRGKVVNFWSSYLPVPIKVAMRVTLDTALDQAHAFFIRNAYDADSTFKKVAERFVRHNANVSQQVQGVRHQPAAHVGGERG